MCSSHLCSLHGESESLGRLSTESYVIIIPMHHPWLYQCTIHGSTNGLLMVSMFLRLCWESPLPLQVQRYNTGGEILSPRRGRI